MNLRLEEGAGSRNRMPACVIAVIVGLFPILSIYASPLRGVSIGDWTLLLSLVAIVSLSFGRIKISVTAGKYPFSPLLVFLVLIVAQSFIIYFLLAMYGADPFSPMTRLVRYLFYLLFVVFVSQGFLDKGALLKTVVVVSLLSTAWVFIQQASYSLFSTPLPGYISYFPTFHSENTFEETIAFLQVSQRYRPSGLFLESSHHAEYVVLGLAILTMQKSSKKSYVLALIMSLGLVVSTSTLGMTLCVVVWLIWFAKMAPIPFSTKLLFGIAMVVMVICLIPLASSIEQVSEALYKLNRYFGLSSSGIFNGARMESYTDVFSQDALLQVFGNGFGSMPEGEPFMTSAAYIWYGLGFLGLVYTLALLVTLFARSRQAYSKMIAVLTIISFFVTEIFVSFWVVLYLCLIIDMPKNRTLIPEDANAKR